MDDKIVKVIFKEGWETMYSNDLTKCDYGQVLQIEGITLPEGNVEVHFSLTEHNGEAPISIGSVKDNVITVDIPDFILQKKDVYTDSYQAYAWIYVTDGESGRTIRKIVFTIDTRAEPTTNVPEDQKDKFLQEVRQVMAETKEVAQSVRTDADNGKFNGQQGDPGKSAYQYAVEGGFKGTEQEFIDLMAQAGQVDLTGYVTKEQHEAELLKAFVKVTTDKATFHHITDSANYRVLDFGMEGITEQETVPGNQLFDLDNTDFKNKGYCTITNGELYADSIAYISIWIPDSCIPFESDEQITVSAQLKCGTANRLGIAVLYEDGTSDCSDRLTNTSYFTATVTSDASKKVVGIGLAYGDNGSAYAKEIMINKGSTALPVEKYVGGMPSPNPEHEEEITLAGVLNEETGRYEHKCCVGNKNFWDKEYAGDVNNWIASTTQTGYADLPIYVGKKGTIVTISYKDTLTTGLGIFSGIALSENDSVNGWIYHSSNTSLINRVTAITSKEEYIRIRCHTDSVKNGTFMQYIGNDLQIEISDTATELLPHASQPFTLTSDRPLTMWDKLVKRDGVWGWSIWQRYKKFSGSSDFWICQNTQGTFVCVNNPFGGIKATRREGYCNMLRINGTNTNFAWIGNGSNDAFYVNGTTFFDNTLDDYGLANWKAFIDENTLEVITYADEEQAFIPLPDEEQTLLHNLEMYYGVTNIYNEQGCPISITYCADQELHWNQKLLQIQQAII